MFTIISAPEPVDKRSKYPWSEMKPGDRFVHPTVITCLEDEMKIRTTLHGSARSWVSRRGLTWQFTTSKVIDCGATFITIRRIA